jgi:hypothetical protein
MWNPHSGDHLLDVTPSSPVEIYRRILSQFSSVYFLLTCCFLGIPFDSEDGGSTSETSVNFTELYGIIPKKTEAVLNIIRFSLVQEVQLRTSWAGRQF